MCPFSSLHPRGKEKRKAMKRIKQIYKISKRVIKKKSCHPVPKVVIDLSLEWNGMEYVIRAKGPALEPIRSFSADRRRREKKKKQERARRKHPTKRDRFSVALYATKERSPKDEKLYAGQNRGGKKKKKK